MKVFVCGSVGSGIDVVRSLVNVSVLYRVHAAVGFGDVPIGGGERFTAQAVAAMLRLVECSAKHDNIAGGSLLVAYDMPLFVDGPQQFMPTVMRDGMDAALADESIWNTCRNIVTATYNSIVFDYIFEFQGGPSEDVLANNGLRPSGNVVWVDNWRQVASIIGAEGF